MQYALHIWALVILVNPIFYSNGILQLQSGLLLIMGTYLEYRRKNVSEITTNDLFAQMQLSQYVYYLKDCQWMQILNQLQLQSSLYMERHMARLQYFMRSR